MLRPQYEKGNQVKENVPSSRDEVVRGARTGNRRGKKAQKYRGDMKETSGRRVEEGEKDKLKILGTCRRTVTYIFVVEKRHDGKTSDGGGAQNRERKGRNWGYLQRKFKTRSDGEEHWKKRREGGRSRLII